jgi:hypothetical protein
VTTAGPIVTSTAIGPGHDGRAELVVTLRHPNGATSTISLDEEALGALLARGDVATLDDLVGRPWAAFSDVPSHPTAPIR